MLKLFRNKNVARVVLWAILILILPAFVIWGTGNLGRSKDKGPSFVGKIDGKKVSFEGFAENITAVKAQVFLNFFSQPQIIDKVFKDKPLLGKLAWDRIIMLREARKMKIKVGDKEIISWIRSHPLFNRSGSFDDRLYEYILRNNLGLDPRNFEEIVRENITIQKMHNMLTKDIKASDEEILENYKSGNEKFDEEKFKQEKDAYSKKILEAKKNKSLEAWLRQLETNTTLNIDLNDYEKYYQQI